MARITGKYAKKTFEDDVKFNLWSEDSDKWSFDGSTLTSQENNVTQPPNPSKLEYAGNNLKVDLVNGIPVIYSGTFTDMRSFVNEKLDGSGSWIPEFRLSNAQIDAVEFYNAFNNIDPTDNIILWKKMLSGDDIFILSDNPNGNYVRSYAGNDHITGSTGNDIVDGGAGDDTIIGGGGIDIAVFSGRFRDYKITKLTGNSFTVQDTRGIDGTDLLQDISTFRFSDLDKNANDLQAAVNTSSATSPSTSVHRFFNSQSGIHFYTASNEEKDIIVNNPASSFKYEGVAYQSLQTDGTELYRFYNADKNYHFLTANTGEALSILKNSLGANYDLITGISLNPMRGSMGYKYEGRTFRVSETKTEKNSTSVYRFFNTQKSVHFYSSNLLEVNNLIGLSHGDQYKDNFVAAASAPLINGGMGYQFEGPAWYV